MLVTCSTDGSNQVVATTSFNEVCDATTIVYPEPAFDLKDEEVEQFTDSAVSVEPLDINATRGVNVVTATVVSPNPDEYAMVEAPADVLTTPALPPDVSSSTTKAKDVFEITYVVPLDCIAKTLVSCSTDCSNQVLATSSFRNHDLDVSSPARHKGLLIRPTSWPSFAYSHDGTILQHERLLPQVTYEEWMMSVSPELESYDLSGAGHC